MNGDPMNPLRDVTLCILGLSLAHLPPRSASSATGAKSRRATGGTSPTCSPPMTHGTGKTGVLRKKSVRRERRTASWSNSAGNSRTLRRSFSPAWTFQAAWQGICPPVCVCRYGVRSGHERPEVSRMVPGDGADRLHIWREGGVHRARDSEYGEGKDQDLSCPGTETEGIPHNLDDVLRRKLHTGTEPEEKIIADASLMADAADNIYGIFSNAEFPYPSVTLSDGTTVKLDKAAFTLYRACPNREDRKRSFSRSSERSTSSAQRLARNCTRK